MVSTGTQTRLILKGVSCQTETSSQSRSVQTERETVVTDFECQVDIQSNEMLAAADCLSTIRDLEDELTCANEEKTKFKNDFEEMMELNRRMVCTIRTLEQGSGKLLKDIQLIEHDISKCQSLKETSTPRDNLAVCTKKKNVLIYGDEAASNCSNILETMLDKSYHTMGVIRSHAPLKEIAKNIFQWTREFSKTDTVVVCLCIDDNTIFIKKHLRQILALGKYTNLILCCRYKSINRECENNLYFKINQFCNLYVKNNNVSVRIIENKRINYYKYRLSKYSLCQLLALYIGTACHSAMNMVFSTPSYHNDLQMNFEMSDQVRAISIPTNVNVIESSDNANEELLDQIQTNNISGVRGSENSTENHLTFLDQVTAETVSL